MAEPTAIDRLRLSIARILAPSSEPEEPQAPASDDSVTATIAEFSNTFKIEKNRLARLVDYEEMDRGDVAAILNAFTNACMVSDDGSQLGFVVRSVKGVTSGQKYQNIVNQMIRETGLDVSVRQYLRNTLKRGDTFLEIIFDNQMNIRRVKSVPPSRMRVNVDEHGDLKQGVQTLITDLGMTRQIPEAYHQVDEIERVVAAWFPWEMIHVKWRQDDELTYSDGSFIEPQRRDWRRQVAIEDALAVARIERAYMREIHNVDVEGKSQTDAERAIRDYKRQLEEMNTSDERRQVWPRKTRTNLYLGRQHRRYHDRLYEDLNEVELIDPRNTGLEHIADIEYLQQKLFREVPAEVVGAGRMRGNDLTQQDVAASKTYQYAQWLMTHQLIIPLCITALRLRGYSPDPDNFEVVWPSVIIRGSWRFADAQFRLSMAHVNYLEWGIASRQRIAQDIYRLSDEDWAQEVETIKSEDDMPTPGGQSDIQQRRQGNQSA